MSSGILPDSERPMFRSSGWGAFRCEHCAGKRAQAARIIREATSLDDLDDEAFRGLASGKCGDHCGFEWADELPPLWMPEPWPECQCCGERAQLVAPLEPVAT